LDGNNETGVLKFHYVTNASIENITIRNGSTDYGGGIYCSNSNPDFTNVIITCNTANIGGGIYCTHSSPDLENVTITGNSGGGIYCNYSSPDLENVTITSNSGSGIYCNHSSSPSLENVIITGNSTSDNGGGIYCHHNSDPTLTNVTITGNSASDSGGGIYCQYLSGPSLTNVTITDNSASYGGGIYCEVSSLNFNIENRCSIYLNTIITTRGYGADIFTLYCNTINVIVDTFTVLTPTDYYASPIDNFTFDILHGIQDTLINSDLYVSVDGDNSNIGTSASEPLRTIRCALSKIYAGSLNQNTIYLSAGIYSSETNGETFPIEWSNYVSLEGSVEEEETILDGNNETGVLKFHYVTNASIENITIRNGSTDYGGGIYCSNSNPDFTNVVITSNTANIGGGIYCTHSSPDLENVTITGNSGRGLYCSFSSNPSLENVTITDNSGSGIYCGYSSNPSLVNVIITGNHSTYRGGGIHCHRYSNPSLVNVIIAGNHSTYSGGGINCYHHSNPSLKNVTLTGNSASYGGGIYCNYSSNPSLENVTISDNNADSGGGIYCRNFSNPSLMNCILWNDSPQEVYFHDYENPTEITISYSDIQGGENGIVTNNNGTVNWLEGNIDADPLFADPQNDDFHLTWANFPIPDSTMSPCIDTGDPSSPLDPDGTIADMGAFYFDQNQQEIEDISVAPISCNLYQNYPNPFNPTTTISFFTTKSTENTEITIYNIKGQKVKTIAKGEFDEGNHSVIWDGTDDSGKPVGSGVYLYELKAGNFNTTKKMILMR
jgi:predicted outer membrane repeat protein/parallel beta-helix repeat protein